MRKPSVSVSSKGARLEGDVQHRQGHDVLLEDRVGLNEAHVARNVAVEGRPTHAGDDEASLNRSRTPSGGSRRRVSVWHAQQKERRGEGDEEDPVGANPQSRHRAMAASC